MITLEPGARVDTYRLIRPLGRGGFAEVWEAQSETDGRRIALKVLTELRADSERALERFAQEGRLAASLASPRCVYVFGAGAFEGCPYIAMEMMSGGTLAGRIEAGPLPARQAVDYVLDVLEGLEAAQRQGILHRDVKPTNVFLGADGRAKIGDFGISKSLGGDARLTQTGAFLGTPYYASPEQIAAEPLDLRSDLYSVGAMLYELVTGKLPYAGTNASQVLAQVLTREPVPFAQTGVSVPPGLQQVVMRLLAKQREKRFQTYTDTRNALLPFSSRGLSAAPRARRFGAIVIDILLFAPLNFALGALILQRNLRGQLALTLSFNAAQLMYFALTERYGAASVGKRLLGLRVTMADGSGAGFPTVLLRSFLFLLFLLGPSLVVQQLSASGTGFGGGPVTTLLPLVAELIALATIVAPMRARNGYAGTHELLTGTRVMALAGREPGAAVASTQPPAVGEASGQDFGPYRGVAVLWQRDGETLTLARDEMLKRDVWVHSVSGSVLPPLEVVRERGPGSLPWLQRGSSSGGSWDAYGAPSGASLAASPGLDWRQMRIALHSVAGELRDRFRRGGSAGVLSSDHVWVDSQGRALVLDFRAQADGGPAEEVTPANWRPFLAQVTAIGLRDETTGRAWPTIPLPEPARVLLAQLTVPTGPGSIDDFVSALEAQSGRPARVTTARRMGPAAVLAVLPVMIVVFALVLPSFIAGFPPWYQDLLLRPQSLFDSLRSASSRAATDSSARRTVEAIRIVLARDRVEAGLAPQLGNQALNSLPPRARAELDSATRQYPSPDARTVADARAWLSARVPTPQPHTGLDTVIPSFVVGMRSLGYLGIVGVLLALVLRGGLLFALFGIAVQRPDGSPAGRLRCLARSLAAWAPLLALAGLGRPSPITVKAPQPVVTVTATAPPARSVPAEPGVATEALVLLAVAGAGFAAWRPSRGVAERVAGVVLVPK